MIIFDYSGNVNLSHLVSLANFFLNLNFRFILNAVKTAVSESFVKVLMGIINDILAKTPYDELFLTS